MVAYRIFSLLTALLIISQLDASPQCVDNSWHLAQRYDNKEYHPVACNCPCQKQYRISRVRNICSQCGHAAFERPLTSEPAQAHLSRIDLQALAQYKSGRTRRD